ncbi:HAD-IA family hydrolase [Gymnodinialimonas hymeniacidonis]|uniref:HAD-IA family hydrolase n=1 Tax=Gymnodinialimonas hymeniacidonis TaxID=3126508 RepID=UPI0034C63F14
MAGRHWSHKAQQGSQPDLVPLNGSLILFDVDGTLLDAGDLIARTMIEAFLAAGEAPPRTADVRSIIGLSLPEMVAHLADKQSADLQAKILSGYRLRYFDLVEQEETPEVFPGADKALRRLREAGFVLGLTTGKARRSTEFMLSDNNWGQYFHTVQCADDNPSKPDPTMVRRAMMATGRSIGETLLVGDSRYDMRMARAAGIRAVGVNWGYNQGVELLSEGAICVARDFEHLAALLLPEAVV